MHVQKYDDEHFIINPTLCASNQFFGWILGLGGAVKIIAPDDLVEKMKAYIDESRKLYE